MNIYENIVILNASLGDEEIETASDKIKDLITNSGGEILKTDVWGRRKLAYEIKKQKKGFYLLLVFKSPSAAIKKLEDYYKVFDPVVKYMIIKLEKKQAEAALKSSLPMPARQTGSVEVTASRDARDEKTEQKPVCVQARTGRSEA
ncbi:MAG: 30S ribosomal protein S6 [Thermodesulfovibrionales bacterium]|nr:30S ribosomal protein S6 [Thermodesulfovibrionales bacterium]